MLAYIISLMRPYRYKYQFKILCNLKWQLLTVVEEPFGGGGWVGQSRWVFIICRLHLISYLMLLLLLEALEGEREQQRQRQPPTSLLLVPAPKMPEVVPAARISITQLGLGRHSGTGRRCRGWRHRRPSCRRRLQECWRVAADDRKRNLFWSKPQLDRDQDHGVS